MIYSPKCAAQTTDETNFCNKCGLDLRPVSDALQSRATTENFDWSKTWLVDMLLTDDERMRRRAAAAIADSPEGAALAEMKRVKEVKAGVITCFAGIGVSVFLWILLGAIAGSVEARDPQGAEILRHVWAAGIIPFFVGLGIILSALFVDKEGLRLGRDAARSVLQSRAAGGSRRDGRATSELPALEAPPPVASVTEHTTDLLTEPAPGPRRTPDGRRVTQ